MSYYVSAPVAYAEDDGSYYPGKYEGTGLPYNYHPYSAYHYGHAARAYSAYPYAAAPYVAAPYAAAPVVASAYAAAPVVAAHAAPVVHPYATAYGSYLANDDGSYFPGKYGPEYQL